MSSSGLRAVCVAVSLLPAFSPARAQLIPIKTIPIAQGDQFQIFPSHNLGLGGVAIALPDSIGDPFANPATAGRLASSRLFAIPTLYTLSGHAGGGRSLPLAMLARRADWYGGLALALQQVDPSRPPQQGFVAVPAVALTLPGGPFPTPEARAHSNTYAFGLIGRALPGNLSIGASAFWTGLHALDGVDLLYSGSIRVRQSGHALDVRIGALKQWVGAGERGTRTLEAVVLHNRYAARHDVVFADQVWDPGLQQFTFLPRTEQNFDYTNTWGAQLKYRIPLAVAGWSIGWLATVNLASHPKLPNYELTNVAVIPWDPGRSRAYDLGVGVSKVRGPSTFAAELIYEPIRSYTWADAMVAAPTVNGDTIAIGGKTIENRFRFSNVVFRIGTGHDFDVPDTKNVIGLQLGLMVRSIHYRLRQNDNIQLEERALRTGWYEWTPTWGLTLRFPEFELRYRGSVTKGAGRPGTQFGGGVLRNAAAGNDFLAVPTGPLSLVNVNTTTHQISLSLPIH